MRDTVKFDPSIPDRQVTGESSTTSAHTCSSASNTEYLDVQSFSSASSYMALPPSLKHGKRHIPLSALEPPGPSSRGTGCSHSQCRCEEESIMQNLCNKRNERLNKPCKNGFCYCFTSDSEDFRKAASTSAGPGQHQCKGVRKEYTYNLPTDTDCSEVVTSDQYFADKEKEKKKKKRVSLPPDVPDSAEAAENGTACCSHKDEKCSKEKCRGKHFQATNKFKEFHCSDSDAPLIHIIQEVKQNVVMSEIRINRSKLKKSKGRSKSAGRAEEGNRAKVDTTNKIINTDALTGENLRKLGEKAAYRPEGKDAGTNTNLLTNNYLNNKQHLATNNNLTPSEDDDSRSDLSNAKPRSHKSKGGRLLLKRIGPDVPFRPSMGPPRKPPRNFSSSSDCSSLASEKIRHSKHGKKKSKPADNSIVSIGDQPTMPANYTLPHDTDDSMNGKDNFKKVSNNSLNSIVSTKPEVTKDTFDKLSAKADAYGDRGSIGSSEGGYSMPVADNLNIPNESFDSGPSSRQEFTPTCPPYSEVASPNTTNINDLLRLLPDVPTGPVIINEPLNKLNLGHSNHPNVEYGEINVVSPEEVPNPEQVGWAPPLIYNMLNTDTATQKFESKHPLAEPQHVGWQPPPKLQIDTVDGTPRTSENEDSHNLAANMELKSTPVKPDIPKDDQTPKNILREKAKNSPQPPSKPARQSSTPKMPTVLEMSHSGDDKTVLSFQDIVSSSLQGNVLPTVVTESSKGTEPVKSSTASLEADSTVAATVPAPSKEPIEVSKDATTKSPTTSKKSSKSTKNNETKNAGDTKDKSLVDKEYVPTTKESTSVPNELKTPAKGATLPSKDQTPKDQNTTSKPTSSGKSFQKRALKHTKSFLESLGFSKKKEGKDSKKEANKDAEPAPPKNVETVATQTLDNVVLQGRRLTFDYASDDTMERRSITPIAGEDSPPASKPAHHSDEGFDFNRTVQSPKPERSSQRKPFSPRNFLKTLQPGAEKEGQGESYKSYASDYSEDFSVAVQDLLGKAKARLESQSTTTAPETVTNTLTDESVGACMISAQADVHPEPIYAEIREDLPHVSDLHDQETKDTEKNKDVVYAKVVKKGGSSSDDQHPLSPHRPAPRPPPIIRPSNSNQQTGNKEESNNQGMETGKSEKHVPVDNKDTSVAGTSSRNVVSPQPSMQSQMSQDKKTKNRPKQGPPPVPSQPLKDTVQPTAKLPTPPNQSPPSSHRSSSSPPSSRGAFSPHLDDFFVHGPLQEVDTGPFASPRSPQNSSDSSIGNVRGGRKMVDVTKNAERAQPEEPHRRRKRQTADDDYGQPQVPAEGKSEPIVTPRSVPIADPASDSLSENDRPTVGPPLPPKSARVKRPGASSVQADGRSMPETRNSSQEDGCLSPDSDLVRDPYYPPLPHLRTTPRSSPQGQSSPDQDNAQELYASAQPGEMSGAGTQSFYSVQSDRFATPVGWHQSQPIPAQPTQGRRPSGHNVHFAEEGWHRSQPINARHSDADEETNRQARQQSRHGDGATGWHKSQPIPSSSHREREQPQGSHQPQPTESLRTTASDQVAERQGNEIYPRITRQQATFLSEDDQVAERQGNEIYPRITRQHTTFLSDDDQLNSTYEPARAVGNIDEPIYANIDTNRRNEVSGRQREITFTGPQTEHQGQSGDNQRFEYVGPDKPRPDRNVFSDGERDVRYGQRTPSNIRSHQDRDRGYIYQGALHSDEDEHEVGRNERIVFSDGERNPRFADHTPRGGDYLHQQRSLGTPSQPHAIQHQVPIYPNLRQSRGVLFSDDDLGTRYLYSDSSDEPRYQRADDTVIQRQHFEQPSPGGNERTVFSDGEPNSRSTNRPPQGGSHLKPQGFVDPTLRHRTVPPQEPIYENTRQHERAIFSDGERNPRLYDRSYYGGGQAINHHDPRIPIAARGFQAVYPNIQHYEAATFPDDVPGSTQVGARGVVQHEPSPPPLPHRRRRSADDTPSHFAHRKPTNRPSERDSGSVETASNMPKPSHSRENVHRTQGQPNHAGGQLYHAEGHSHHGESQPHHAEGQSHHAEGQPHHAGGRPQHAGGQPRHAEGPSYHAEGQPQHAGGQPRHAEGPSHHAEGQPHHAGGHLHQAGGHLQTQRERQAQSHIFHPKPESKSSSNDDDHFVEEQPARPPKLPTKPQTSSQKPHPQTQPLANPANQSVLPPKPQSQLPPKPQSQLPIKPQSQPQLPPKPQWQPHLPPKELSQPEPQNIPKTPHSKQQQQEFDYNLLPSPPNNTLIASPPHNISIGNPPVIEYSFPSRSVEHQGRSDPIPSTSNAQTAVEQRSAYPPEPERPLTSSTPQPPTIVEPVPSTSYNNSNEKYTPPRARALSKSDLSQASDIFLENLNQKNVNVTRFSDRSDPSDRSDEEKRSNLDSPVAISQFYYYDSSTGNGDSSNSSFIKDPNDSRRGATSEDAEYDDPCCGENCPHLKPGGFDTVDYDNLSPETISFKSCRSEEYQEDEVRSRSEEDKDENMNSSTSRVLNLSVTDKPPINPYESLKHKIRSSFRKSKNLFKKKRLALPNERSAISDNDTRNRRKDLILVAFEDRKGESDFEVDYISAIELLNESTKDGSLKRQLEQTVSLCRKIPEFEASPEMVEAERLLLYSTLKEKSTCKSNDSISSYRSTPKDFISGHVCVTSFEIPIKPNIHHDEFFNYYYIGVFTNGQDIRSTQSAEKVDDVVFFAECDMLFEDLISDFEISVDLYVLRLRKLSSPPVQQDNVPVKIRKSSLSDSQEEVVSRFRMHGNFVIRAADLGPFEVKTQDDNVARRSEFYLVSNNVFTLPISLFPRNINLSNEVWVTANAAYRFKNFELSGFLNVGELNENMNWSRRWCQIDALHLYFWNYPQDSSEVPPILTINLASCISNPVKSANREICPKPKSFQLDVKPTISFSSEESDDEAINSFFFSTESQEEYNFWVKGLNYVLDFIRAWKVQVQ